MWGSDHFMAWATDLSLRPGHRGSFRLLLDHYTLLALLRMRDVSTGESVRARVAFTRLPTDVLNKGLPGHQTARRSAGLLAASNISR